MKTVALPEVALSRSLIDLQLSFLPSVDNPVGSPASPVGDPPARYLVALSGGVDSSALLIALHRHMASVELDTPIVALHVDHQLHPQSAEWAAHCSSLCQRLGVPLIQEALHVSEKGNLEAAARDVRYGFFRRHIMPNDLLLLGQHRHDQTETLLLRLFQGRGWLPMRESGQIGSGYFLRPWLDLDKSDLTTYMNALGESWVEDPSNQSLKLQRNFLRLEVIPKILGQWPKFASALSRVAQASDGQMRLAKFLMKPYGDQVPLSELPDTADIGLAWLREYLAARAEYRTGDAQLAEFFRQCRQAKQAVCDLSSGAQLRTWRSSLYYIAVPSNVVKAPISTTLMPGQRVAWEHGHLHLAHCAATAPGAFRYQAPVRVDSRSTNDPNVKAVLAGHDLKRLFQDAQVPPWSRQVYPLLLSADDLLGLAVIGRSGGDAYHPQLALTVGDWCRCIFI